MSDSLERLYQAVIAAKDLDPAMSRTARLFQRGPTKMAKKLAEEAIEVVIDAVNGNTEASLGGTLGYDTTATAASGVGSYNVTPKGLTSANYAITYGTGTLDITKKTLTVTAAGVQPLTVG